jgi:hypothetical protein
VAYLPDWEPLADALRRVIEAGSTEPQAKIDLCRAVADKKISIRVRIAPSDDGMRGRVFPFGNVGVPPHLAVQDFDWVQSRPLKPWSIGPMPGQHYSWIGGWENRPLDLIELSTADVIVILCGAGTGGGAGTRSKSGRGAKTRGIEEAIDQLWPNGIPNGLSAKERNNAILGQLKVNNSSIPGERMIQRALRARQLK